MQIVFDYEPYDADTLDDYLKDPKSNQIIRNYTPREDFDLVIFSVACKKYESYISKSRYSTGFLYLQKDRLCLSRSYFSKITMCFLKHDSSIIDTKYRSVSKNSTNFFVCICGLYKDSRVPTPILIDVECGVFIVGDPKGVHDTVPFSRVAFAASPYRCQYTLHPFEDVCPLLTQRAIINSPKVGQYMRNEVIFLEKQLKERYNKYMMNVRNGTLAGEESPPSYEGRITISLKNGSFTLYPYVIAYVLDVHTPLRQIEGLSRTPFKFLDLSVASVKLIIGLILGVKLPSMDTLVSLIKNDGPDTIHYMAEILDILAINHYSTFFSKISTEMST